jgi:hypothetical protein
MILINHKNDKFEFHKLKYPHGMIEIKSIRNSLLARYPKATTLHGSLLDVPSSFSSYLQKLTIILMKKRDSTIICGHMYVSIRSSTLNIMKYGYMTVDMRQLSRTIIFQNLK